MDANTAKPILVLLFVLTDNIDTNPNEIIINKYCEYFQGKKYAVAKATKNIANLHGQLIVFFGDITQVDVAPMRIAIATIPVM